jgi:hypothetical protein
MHGPEQIDAHHPSDAAGVIAITFGNLRLEERLRMPGLDAS